MDAENVREEKAKRIPKNKSLSRGRTKSLLARTNNHHGPLLSHRPPAVAAQTAERKSGNREDERATEDVLLQDEI